MSGVLKFKMQFFEFSLISTNSGKLPIADISEDQQIFSWIFFSCSDYIFYVGNKVCTRWDQKVHQKKIC